MMQSGRCINCKVVCNTCRRYRPYVKAHRNLADIVSDLCSICGRPYLNDNVDIDTYYLDPMLGHPTRFGSGEDDDVGSFIERHKNDILLAFRTNRIEDDENNFYFEEDISFYQRTESSDIQRTTIKFFILPITSDTVDLNIFQIMMMFLEKIEEFTGYNSDWTTFRINYLRLCWGPYRPMMEGSFIPTPKWIFVKHAVVNIRCSDDHKLTAFNTRC